MNMFNQSIRTYFFLLCTLWISLTPDLSRGQSCNSVDILYDQPVCYKSKGGSAGSPNGPCTPVTLCTRQAYTYTAAGGPWASYLWTISAGPASPVISPSPTVANISITWPLTGTYILTLTVTDGSGNTFTKCLEITAKEKPIAGFSFAPNNGCAGSIVTFSNSTTYSGTPYYSWDFGDPSSGANNNSNLANPTHIYNSAGSYIVTLIAYSSILVPAGSTGTHGGDSMSLVTCCADTIRKTVTVVNGNVKIECISTVCAGTQSKYTAVGCVSPTWGTPVGGTTVSTSGNTITVLWGNGNPQGQLSVTCGGGCTAYATVPIIPSTPIIVGNTSPCLSGPGSYTLPFLPGTTYTWTLLDVTTATNANSLLSTYPDNNVAWIDWSLATPGNTYLLSINLNNKHLCCTSNGSLSITPKPFYSISGPPSICSGQNGTFSPNQAGSFNWSVNPTTGVSPTSATGTGSYTAAFASAGNFIITATNTSGAFCNTTASTGVTVVPVPIPGTITGPLTACTGNPYAYSMSTPAPSGYYYEWTISNGVFQPGAATTATGNSVTAQWTTLSGSMTVVLKQSSSPFCQVAAGGISVIAATVGSISGPSPVCVDGNGIYTLSGGTIPPGTTVSWAISPSSLGTILSGQGTSSVTILWHGAGGAGPWGPAMLTAITGCGAATPLTGIIINPKFSVSILSTGTNVCQPGGVSLTANGAPLGATYTWSPGGASTQTISTITSPNTYTVVVTAGGCSAQASLLVPDPFAIIPITCGVGICNGSNSNEGLGVQVTKPATGTFTYEWHSGTCTSPGPILSTTTTSSTLNNFMATSSGNYCVIVKYGSCQKCLNFIVKKICCPDINHPQITNNTQLTCDQYSFTGTTPNPTGATITWDFGDGTTAPGVSGVPITHTYATAGIYCVTFCVGAPSPNPTNCTGNCVSTQAIVPLAAGFSYTLGCNGCLNVTNQSAVYGNPSFVTWAWDFGDATTSTLQNPPQHCYATGGTYIVKLVATYNDGTITCTKSDLMTIVYTPLSIVTIAPACSGTPILFSSSPGGFSTYLWNFGDGFTAYSSPIQHAYNAAGPFTASLSVTDILGNTCTATKPLTVLPGIGSCTILPAYICSGSAATLTAPAGPYTYLWEVETSPNVFVSAPGTNNGATYSTTIPGNYHVIVTNGNGCFCISNKVAVIAVSKPKASFSINPGKNICGPGIVALSAGTITGTTYDWYLNGSFGTPVSSGSTYVTFLSTTTTFNLIVTNQYGCKDTCTQTVTVNTPPSPPLITSSGICAGVPISLTVTNYASNITWNNGANTTSIIVFNAGTYVATYTDPVTGCTSNSSIAISRRPSAGLFPHSCDSIPCKCIRPFAIYAPNPLIGIYASNYTVDWYNANTNAYLYTGNPYNNGGLGVQTGSYYIVLTDQSSGCKDTSNAYSILVPKCDTCDCKASQWGEVTFSPTSTTGGTTGTPITAQCNKEYTLQCNKTYNLSAYFNCKDTACKGKVTYKLQPPTGPAITGLVPASFTPVVSGNYVLTLYGSCGDRICDSCIIRFNVICPCDCTGSKWTSILLTQNNVVPPPIADHYSDNANGSATAAAPAVIVVPPLPLPLSCGGTYKLLCNTSYTISAAFQCNDSNCKSHVTYSLLGPTGPPVTGNAPLSFTPTVSGTYVLTLYGWCGNKICDSCVVKLVVTCPCDCNGSHWGDIQMAQGDPVGGVNTTQFLNCGASYKIDCNKPYSINTAFYCKDTICKGKVTYSLLPPSGIPITGNAPLNFTPTVSGTYTLTLYGWCGDRICDSCVIKFNVVCRCDCNGSKWGEKTLGNGNTTTTLLCKDYNWKCNTPFIVNASYSCALPNCNSAVSYKLVPAFGSTITGNLPLSYTPVQSGVYTLTIYGMCGNKICDSCVVAFKVDCPQDTVCCQYDIKINTGALSYTVTPSGNATIAAQAFTISGLATANLTEVRAEVLSFDLNSNFNNECMACKSLPFVWASMNSATAIGAVPGLVALYGGTSSAVFNPSGAAVYQNPRAIIWNNGTSFPITGPVTIKFILPTPPLIDCCVLTGKVCVKFTFRDNNCNECEVIACFDVSLKK